MIKKIESVQKIISFQHWFYMYVFLKHLVIIFP